jgi:hypothetical protein
MVVIGVEFCNSHGISELLFLNFTIDGGWLNWLGAWSQKIHSHDHMEGWVLRSQGGKLQWKYLMIESTKNRNKT